MKYIKVITRLLPLLMSSPAWAGDNCPCDDPDQRCSTLDSKTTKILDNQDGWASDGNGVSGGEAGKKIYWVTTLREGKGPGTLRTALEASKNCPLWIKFDVSGTIKLTDEIDVNSNKTVDGRDANITIDTKTDISKKECEKGGGNRVHGFEIESKKNIAILNITFDDDFDHWDGDCEGSDGIRIEDSHHIWIYHNTFKKWADGAIDIDEGSDAITIAWNYFRKVHQAIAIRDGNTTFHHNYCSKINHRCPHSAYKKDSSDDGVYVHSFNNVIENWQGDNIIEARGKKATLLSEYDMFILGKRTESDTIEASKKGGIADIKHAQDFGDSVSFDEKGKADEDWKNDSRGLVSIKKCSSNSCLKDLRDRIIDEAGASL